MAGPVVDVGSCARLPRWFPDGLFSGIGVCSLRITCKRRLTQQPLTGMMIEQLEGRPTFLINQTLQTSIILYSLAIYL